MTTASGGVAVIATQLAHTDRRALSQAWYSALHLAHDTSPLPARLPRIAPATARTRNVARTVSRRETSAATAPAPRAHVRRDVALRVDPASDRRRPAVETTRRIERAVATLAARRPVPVAHTVDVDGGRVRLLVHSDGQTTRVVALCSTALREPVERALASARFTLAGAGLAVCAP